jgi:hypothetical protein
MTCYLAEILTSWFGIFSTFLPSLPTHSHGLINAPPMSLVDLRETGVAISFVSSVSVCLTRICYLTIT